MDAAAAPRRLDVGKVINETFSIYAQNAVVVLASSIVVFVVIGAASGLLHRGGGLLLVALAEVVRIAGAAFYTGVVVRLVEDVRDGRRDHSLGELVSAAAPAIVALAGFGILFGVGVTVGLFLLVVPGLILLTSWSVGAPAIVIEGAGPIAAFGRSWRLVQGNAWPTFGALLVMLLFVVVIGVVLRGIAAPVGDGAIVVADVIANVLTAPLFAIAVSVIYFELGGRRSPPAA